MDRHTERITPCVDRGRDWSDVATLIPVTPRIVESYYKLGRGKEGFFSRTFRGYMALLTPWFQTSSL